MAAVMADPKIDELDCMPQRIKTAAMQQKCILLIEDSEEAMLLVRFAVEEYGKGAFRLEWAHNLSSGLDHLAQGGIDIVLLDLGLPESSGAESYAWVREIAPELPVVVLTGDSQARNGICGDCQRCGRVSGKESGFRHATDGRSVGGVG